MKNTKDMRDEGVGGPQGSPLENILEALRGVTKSGDGYAAFCPAHEDTKGKSLTVAEAEDGRILLNCHKGCAFFEVMAAIGMEARDAFPRTVRRGDTREFHVRDASGNKIGVHHRKNLGGGKKKVWWSRPDGKNGLGGMKGSSLPLWGSEAVSSVPRDKPIILVEGEKAAFFLTHRGVPALGTVTGAAETPGEKALSVLAGREVVVWPDNDDEGRAHMRRIAKSLQSLKGTKVRWFDWGDAPEKGDAADHPAVRRGGDELALFVGVLYAAPVHVPPHDPKTDGSAPFVYIKDSYGEWLYTLKRSKGVTGIRTGIAKLDNGIYGLNKGNSYIIAARPSLGKSLICGMAALTAARRGNRVLLQSPEMSARQYAHRLVCYMANVDYFESMRGNNTDEENARCLEAMDELCELPIAIDEIGSQTTSRVRQEVERQEPDLLIVDYLQFLRANDPSAPRSSQVGQLSQDLTAIKGDYNIPVLLAAQLNRAVETRYKGEPELYDLRDAGEIEQDAEVVMFIHRPEKGEVAATDEAVRLLCKKNREGELFTVDLRFVPGQQWLTDKHSIFGGSGRGAAPSRVKTKFEEEMEAEEFEESDDVEFAT